MRITGETVKNAIIKKLLELYPDVSAYKEEQINLDFPHFFVYQLNVQTVEDRRNHYFQTYIINIRYRQVADVETEPKIEQKLENMGIDLLTNFVDITIDNRIYKIKEAYYEKVDKVLHFSCQVKLQLEKDAETGVKMQILDEKVIVGNKQENLEEN